MVDLDQARGIPASPEEKAGWEVTWPLVEELLAADTIVLGVPMYNFSVPSTFKAWFDRVLVPPLITDPATGRGPLSGKKVVVASARGGAYGPGTPRHDSDHQEPCLKAALGMIGLAADLTFLHAELTKSAHGPRLAVQGSRRRIPPNPAGRPSTAPGSWLRPDAAARGPYLRGGCGTSLAHMPAPRGGVTQRKPALLHLAERGRPPPGPVRSQPWRTVLSRTPRMVSTVCGVGEWRML